MLSQWKRYVRTRRESWVVEGPAANINQCAKIFPCLVALYYAKNLPLQYTTRSGLESSKVTWPCYDSVNSRCPGWATAPKPQARTYAPPYSGEQLQAHLPDWPRRVSSSSFRCFACCTRTANLLPRRNSAGIVACRFSTPTCSGIFGCCTI